MRYLLAAAILLLVLAVDMEASLATYPVRVTFAFDYRGSHYETSYLTTVKKRLNNPELSLFRWEHVRDKISMALPDGSSVILRAEWPAEWTDFAPKIKYASKARWFWLNNADAPTEIVYGDAATRTAPDRGTTTPFTWIDVKGTIEHVGDELLAEAGQSDQMKDSSERLLFSNLLGGSLKSSGVLFASIFLTPVVAENVEGTERIARMRAGSGWSPVSGKCRIMPTSPAVSLRGLTKFSASIGLLPTGGIWSGDGGPHPGEPIIMYRTEARFSSHPSGDFSVLPYREPAVQLVHAVEWNRQICTDVAAPNGATAELIEFQDGSIVLLQPGDNIAVLRPERQ